MSTAPPPPDPSYILHGSGGPVTSLAFPTAGTLYSGSSDGHVLLWDLNIRRTKATLRAHEESSVLWICPMNNDVLYTQGRDGFLTSWKANQGTWEKIGHVGCSVLGFCSSSLVTHDSTELVASPSAISSQIDIYDMHQNSLVMSLRPPSNKKMGMCMSIQTVTNGSESSNQILVGYENGGIYLYDLRTTQLVSGIEEAHPDSVMCMAFSSKSRRGYSASADRTIVSWVLDADSNLVKTGDRAMTNPGLNDITIRTDDRLIVCAGWDCNIRLFGCKKLKPLAVLSYHRESVQCCSFSPDNMLACGSKDRLISVWDIYR